MYDHLPSPKGSWPFAVTREVHLSTTAVKAPPGWWPEEKFSPTCDWAKDENCHILWNQQVAWKETWLVQYSFVSVRQMVPIPKEWHRARLYWSLQSVLPGCRPFGFSRRIQNVLEVSISSMIWFHESNLLDNEYEGGQEIERKEWWEDLLKGRRWWGNHWSNGSRLSSTIICRILWEEEGWFPDDRLRTWDEGGEGGSTMNFVGQ